MENRTSIVLFAVEVMGANAALRWFDTPNEELEGQKPSDIWDTDEGAHRIRRVLTNIKALRE